MEIKQLLAKKRDNLELTPEELSFFVSGSVSGSVTGPQTADLLMATRIHGMSPMETVALTRAMVEAGSRLDTSRVSGNKLDKHSTGGVGDKTSIILAPLMASMGVKIPMISRRAQGHTGGTIDKIESIPGLNTSLSADEMMTNLTETGLFIAEQSEELTPVDKILYALRDETSTMDSIPLIAASIMSKKLSAGLDGLVLDVKTGSGAFMPDIEQARKLAQTMVNIGNSMGVQTVGVITDMDQPLGRTVGNTLELKECLSALRGRWADDLKNVTLTLGAWMMNLNDAIGAEAKVVELKGFGRKNYMHECMEFLEKGDAFKKFVEFVDAQGGDTDMVFNPSLIPTAKHVQEITSPKAGYIRELGARAVGEASMLLDAGPKSAGKDPTAGIIINSKAGDQVSKGDVIAIMHADDPELFKQAQEAYQAGVLIAQRAAAPRPLVHESIT